MQRAVEAKSTWWKRLFTVLEIAVAAVTISISLLLCFTGAFDVPATVDDLAKGNNILDRFFANTEPARASASLSKNVSGFDPSTAVPLMTKKIPYKSLALFILVPSTLLRLLRIGVTYVVEGGGKQISN